MQNVFQALVFSTQIHGTFASYPWQGHVCVIIKRIFETHASQVINILGRCPQPRVTQPQLEGTTLKQFPWITQKICPTPTKIRAEKLLPMKRKIRWQHLYGGVGRPIECSFQGYPIAKPHCSFVPGLFPRRALLLSCSQVTNEGVWSYPLWTSRTLRFKESISLVQGHPPS